MLSHSSSSARPTFGLPETTYCTAIRVGSRSLKLRKSLRESLRFRLWAGTNGPMEEWLYISSPAITQPWFISLTSRSWATRYELASTRCERLRKVPVESIHEIGLMRDANE